MNFKSKVKKTGTDLNAKHDTLEWIKTATAEEIVTELIDRLDVEDWKTEESQHRQLDILTTFLDRAKADPYSAVGIAYETFANEEHPEPHACVKTNFELKSGKWTGQIGRKVWRREFDKAMKDRSGLPCP